MKKPLEIRFWEKVQILPPDQCWPWLAFKDRDGYGKIQMPGNTSARATRVCWELVHGEITDKKLVVMHLCDHPPCVNPGHLKLGTVTDNNRDRALKKRNRNQSGEKNNMVNLDTEAVHVIRYLSETLCLSHTEISEIFRVSRPAVSLIIEKERWTHI